MKKLLFSITIALSLFVLASCGGEDNPGGSSSESPIFTAVIDNSLTLNGQKVNWESGDEINII